MKRPQSRVLGSPWIGGICVFAFLAGCATVPYTGRKHLVLIPEDQELSLGSDSYKQVLSSSQLVTSGPDYEMVQRVGKKIAAVANQPDFTWEFNLIKDDKTVNAFCLPGGKVAVYTGIMPVAQTEAGLATVMGHEIGHAIAHHGAERMTDDLAFQVGGAALGTLLQNKSPATQQVVMTAYGVGGQVGVMLPFSRGQESEADHIGLILMAKSGYDPHEAEKFWTRMEKLGGSSPPEWLSTHPSHGRRVDQIDQWMPEAMKYYEAAR